MTPVYVRELGNYDYGVWEMIASLVGYFGLIDMGLRPTISRFTAYFRGESNSQQAHALFSTSVVLMSLVGIVIAGALFSWAWLSPDSFSPENGNPARYALVLQLIGLQVLLACPRYSMESTFEGQLQYTLKNNIIMAHTIAGAAYLYFMMPHYDPLLLLCWVNIAQGVSKLILFALLLHRPQYGGHMFRARNFQIDLAKQMYRFGFKSFVQGIASRVETKADVIVIGSLIGPQAVVFYSIPQALSNRIRELVQVLSHVLMPAFAELHSAGQQERMIKVFMLSSRFIVGVLGLLGFGIVYLGGEFITLWMGAEYAERGKVILWLLVAYVMLGALIPLDSRYLTAVNRHGVLAKLAIVRATLNITFSLIGAGWIGVAGVALGSTLATAIVAPFVWHAVFRNLHIHWLSYAHKVLQPMLLSGAAMGLAIVAINQMGFSASWLGFLEKCALGGGVFLVVFYTVGLSSSDRSLLLDTIRRRGRPTQWLKGSE